MAVLLSYKGYANSKASQFDHESWDEEFNIRQYAGLDSYRTKSAELVMAYIIKKGMAQADVIRILGEANLVREETYINGFSEAYLRSEHYELNGVQILIINYDKNDRIISYYLSKGQNWYLF